LNYCGYFNFLIPNLQKRFKGIERDCETEQNQRPQSGNGGGGAAGAGIVSVHRKAMRLNGNFEIVAGLFSRNADRSRQTGKNLGIIIDIVLVDFS
jgi:hypothetical protein